MTPAERDRIDALRFEIMTRFDKFEERVVERIEVLEDERVERIARAKQRAAIVSAFKWTITTAIALAGVLVLIPHPF